MDQNRERIQILLRRIREIVGESLSSNKEIGDIMQELESLGLKVNLNFIALIGGPPQLLPEMSLPLIVKDGVGFIPQGKERIEFKLTSGDRDFLKEIGISFDSPEAGGEKTGE
jgi:hypothetical protein